MATYTCSKCGSEYDAGLRSCPKCAAPRPDRSTDVVLDRLRSATDAELALLASVFDVKVEPERELRTAELRKAFYGAAKETDYRKALVAVTKQVAAIAKWKSTEVKDTAPIEWIEEYVYQGLSFGLIASNPKLTDRDRATARERAEASLNGAIDEPESASVAAIKFLALGAGYGAAAFLGAPMIVMGGAYVAIEAVRWLLSPSASLAPATMVLIHIRKRAEFEEALPAPKASAA